MMLSGTPMYNRVSDIAPLMNILKGRTVLPENPTEFNKEYVNESQVDPGFIGSMLGIKPGVARSLKNKKRLRDILRGAVDVHEEKAFFPERKDALVSVPMSDKQEKLYNYLSSDMPWWARWKISLGLPPNKSELQQLNAFSTGVRQVSNTPAGYVHGMTALQGGEQSPKIVAAVKSIQGKMKTDKNFKAFVYSNYLESGLRPMSALLASKGVPNEIFHGGLTPKEKGLLVSRYNSGSLPVLLGSSSASEGLDLKGTKLMQVLEPHFNRSKLEQVIARAIRYKSHEGLPKNERKVRVEEYRSTPKGSLLDRILSSLRGKRTQGIDEWLDTQARNKQNLIDELAGVMRDVS